MVHGKNRIPYRIDRRLPGLAGPDYDAAISFGLPIEPEDSQYGEYRLIFSSEIVWRSMTSKAVRVARVFRCNRRGTSLMAGGRHRSPGVGGS